MPNKSRKQTKTDGVEGECQIKSRKKTKTEEQWSGSKFLEHATRIKAEKTMERIQCCVKTCTSMVEDKVAPKGAYNNILTDVSNAMSEIAKITNRIEDMLAEKQEAPK